MEAKPLAIALAALMLTAGCLGTTDDPTAEDEDQSSAAEPASRDAADGETGEADAAARTEPTLDEAPDWQPGDWWEVEVSSPFIGESFTVKRVVTGAEDDEFLVGMPTDGWDERALILHVPGFGEVHQDTLGFEVHDVGFQPLDFPLTDGTSWTTSYEGADVEATVATNPDGTASVHFCCERNITLTYDPGVGAITSFTLDEGFVAYEVVDHGEGYDDVVTVPHGHDLVFFHGVFAGAVGVREQAPKAPAETVELDDGYDRVSFFQAAGPLGIVDRPASSAYHERAEGPDGTVYETTHAPTSGSVTTSFHETTEVGGTWSFTHAAPGPGIAFTEGIAYHVFQTDLATGERLDEHADHDMG